SITPAAGASDSVSGRSHTVCKGGRRSRAGRKRSPDPARERAESHAIGPRKISGGDDGEVSIGLVQTHGESYCTRVNLLPSKSVQAQKERDMAAIVKQYEDKVSIRRS